MSRLEMILWAFAIGLGITTVFILYRKRNLIRESFQVTRTVSSDAWNTDISGTKLFDLSGTIPNVNLAKATEKLLEIAGRDPEILKPVEGKPGEYVDLSGNTYKGPIDLSGIVMTVNGPIMNPLPRRPYIAPTMENAKTTCPVSSSEYKVFNQIITISEAIPSDLSKQKLDEFEAVLKQQYNLNDLSANLVQPNIGISDQRAKEMTESNLQQIKTPLEDAILIRKDDPEYSEKLDRYKQKRATAEAKFNAANCSSWGFTLDTTITIPYLPPSLTNS